jgi:hypothetical protein
MRSHFWPFTGVLRKIFGFLTREVWKFLKTPRITRLRRKATAGSGSHQSVFKQRKGSEGLPQSDQVGIIFASFVTFVEERSDSAHSHFGLA